MFDKDGDGDIDIPEFVNTLKSLGQNPSQKEIDDMMKIIDKNGKYKYSTCTIKSMSMCRYEVLSLKKSHVQDGATPKLL